METRSETPRETWLQPIVALLREGEFGEAYALAAYFPNTRNRQLVQFAALLGQNKMSEADTLLRDLRRNNIPARQSLCRRIRQAINGTLSKRKSLKKFDAETQSLVAEFATILNQVDLNLLDTADKAIEAQYFELADFCIEFQLLTHPETSSLVNDVLLFIVFCGEKMMEIWDSRYPAKQSQVFKLEAYLQSSPLPTNRSEAKVLELELELENWSKKVPQGTFNGGKKDIKKESKNITIERHTRIEFPSECILEQKVDLKIQLTQEIPKSTRVQEKISLPVESNTKQVKLNVKVTAPGFAIRPSQQQLTVLVKGDSNEVTFTLFPLETGKQVIEIEFFQEATRVGYLLVPTKVRSHSVDESSPKVLSMEDPIDGLKNLESMTVNPDKHTLNVTWIERESKLLYTIFPANRLGE
ncbi:hypothetical protein [Microcystis aeruginosa]|uniref:hypothetical protein n=1 Tax=Microcystis aeruginosa TaxID=1126 RepID=UPI0004B4213C|nr:hypothetical protein [Microcystis aeruginosa]MDB9394690.1 hypothetical protein [Microcystis aeruginosa CS-573]